MKWRKSTLDEITAHLGRLGLSKCPICESGTLAADKRPGFLHVGDIARHRSDLERQPDAGVYFVVVVICSVCGYTMLFDSDKFHSGDEQTMYLGDVEPEQ